MTNYELAKLVLLAGVVDSRKRMQKTVHLLQAARNGRLAALRRHVPMSESSVSDPLGARRPMGIPGL